MSKKNLFKLSLVVVMTMSASSVFAGTIESATTIGGGTFSPSNKVKISVIASTVNYAACSGHTSGDRSICTNNVDPKLYWTTKSVGSDPQAVNNATDSFTGSGYTTL